MLFHLMVMTAPTKVFQLLSALPFINHTLIDPLIMQPVLPMTSASHIAYYLKVK